MQARVERAFYPCRLPRCLLVHSALPGARTAQRFLRPQFDATCRLLFCGKGKQAYAANHAFIHLFGSYWRVDIVANAPHYRRCFRSGVDGVAAKTVGRVVILLVVRRWRYSDADTAEHMAVERCRQRFVLVNGWFGFIGVAASGIFVVRRMVNSPCLAVCGQFVATPYCCHLVYWRITTLISGEQLVLDGVAVVLF
jgi:hypothetical protein